MYSRVYVEIINMCNMDCSFCHGHSREPGIMNTEEFTRVLDQLEGKTKYIYFHLMGEPLTHPEILRFISTAKARGFFPMITTNGTLLGSWKEDLIKSGLHKVNISLHSFEEGGEEAFVKYLGQVADFADEASKAGIIVVMRLWNNGLDGGRNERVLEFLKNRLEGDWEENTRGIRIRYKLHLEWGERFEWPDREAEDYGEDVFCYGMRDHFGILCDGTVVPCCLDSDGVINLGNVFEEDLDVILGSPRAEAIRKGFGQRKAAEELCRKCGYAQRFR